MISNASENKTLFSQPSKGLSSYQSYSDGVCVLMVIFTLSRYSLPFYWSAKPMEVLCDDKIICVAFWLLIPSFITINITALMEKTES